MRDHRRKIFSLGDVNPIEHGGGFLFKTITHSKLAKYGTVMYDLEWTFGTESIVDGAMIDKRGKEIKTKLLPVYRVSVDEDDNPTWISREEINKGLDDCAKFGEWDVLDPKMRALYLVEAGWYGGWNNLDPDPYLIKVCDLKKRWNLYYKKGEKKIEHLPTNIEKRQYTMTPNRLTY